MTKREEKFIKVTTTQYYAVGMIDEERTDINGWTLDQVKESWFEDYDMGKHHATRDGHKIGNTEMVQKVEFVDVDEFKKDMDEQVAKLQAKRDAKKGYPCMVCGKPMPDYEPQGCCDGRECGCMGLPIEPPICSEECWDSNC